MFGIRSASQAVLLSLLLAGRGGYVLRAADEPPGAVIYREHCGRCHGENGAGTADTPEPLIGDRSINQLAAYIDETMPEDDPQAVRDEAARNVAEFIHGTFYSPLARDRHRPARVELSRLTIREYHNTLADLFASFRGRGPNADLRRGLRGEYFHGRNFDRKDLVFERIDPQVNFFFGVEGPDPEQFEPNRFAIRWTGSIVPPETGLYEFVIRTEHSAKLALNTAWYEPPLIDAYVKSGADTEYRASLMLLGGRTYPLRLEFSKANQGVDNKKHEPFTDASISLLWKPPHGDLEPVPERVLIPLDSPQVFVATTPFPPDDKSIGYERGTTLSKEWFSAATAAAGETAAYVIDHIEHLANVKRDAPDRANKLRRFAATFAERAFRRPLTDDLRALVIDRPFADAPDLDTALKRSILLVLGSPRFLFRESAAVTDPFATAARLSFGLWDSLPDQSLWEAAVKNQLATPEQVRRQAERMVSDRRTRAKLRDFFFTWLRVDLGPELTKDASIFGDISPGITADLRTSLDLFLDDVVWTSGDFRQLFTDDEVYLSERLGPLYGASLPGETGFRRVRLDNGRRGGVICHPYLLSVFSYSRTTSPIHRGVFLARSVLGNVLKPPQEAITPLAPEQHPDLSTRQRVALQTKAVACQSCHMMINPLGFALEDFDAIGRYRTVEKTASGEEEKVDATGSYLPREGPEAEFRGGRELAAYLAVSRDAQEAFVQNLFHALTKQPLRAWGADTLKNLHTSFADAGFDIRRLMVDSMVVASSPPQNAVANVTPAGHTVGNEETQP